MGKVILKQGSTLFLKVILLLIAIGVLAGMLWFPQTEGRAANLSLVSIYTDLFIIFIYIGSIPFFVGLYQAFKLLNFIDANKAFSQDAVSTLKNIRFASLCLIGFIIFALFYIRFFSSGEDSAGPTTLGILITLVLGVIATAVAILQRLFQKAVDLKSVND
jgi:hypothetical protein